jgi:hypothetical protein
LGSRRSDESWVDLLDPATPVTIGPSTSSCASSTFDLPTFKLSFTNPRACLASGVPIRLYRTLVVHLELDRHRRSIDEHIEVVEAVFDALAESRNHIQALAFQIIFELAIVALLLLDVALFLWDSFLR